jgi:peptidylprolyl isomerase
VASRGRAVAAAALLAAAACASGPPRVPPTIAAAPFSPELGVNIAEMTRTRGGAYHKDLSVGTGPTAIRGSEVSVRYSLYLVDGTLLEGGPNDAPITFALGSGKVIRGWDEAIPGMRVGGIRKIVVPPELGYGRQGGSRVPPNAVLVFDVQLTSVR